MRPKEFSVVYMIQRQLPNYWQELFEQHLELDINDVYVMHAMVLKRNRFFMNKKRFFILSSLYMYNAIADFTDSDCRQVKFDKMKWKVPLVALTQIDLEASQVDTQYLKVTCKFNLDELNAWQKTHGGKQHKKDKRSVKFADLATARDFLFHLKRLYHLHCRSHLRISATEKQPLVVMVKM